MSVLVTVPYWRTPGTVRRCVDSILAQTESDLVCAVLNDGDEQTPPWPALRDIDDPRLVRVDLPENRGRYFADAIAVFPYDDRFDWWMPVDSDDWLSRGRLAALLAGDDGRANVVMSPWTQHHLDGSTAIRPVRPPRPGQRIRAVAHLSSLWRPSLARQLVHPGQRMAWDQIMTTAAWTFGRPATVDDAGYHRVMRPDSLMRSRVHGKGTSVRRAAKRHQRALWRQMREGSLEEASEIIAQDATGSWSEVFEDSALLDLALSAEV